MKVSLREAEGHLGHLIEKAAAGQEVVIAAAGGSRVRLVPLPEEEEEQGAPPAYTKSPGSSKGRSDRKAAVEGTSRLRAAVKTHPTFGPEISTLELLDDQALWNAAQTEMPRSDSERMEKLHRKHRLTGLSEAEAQELARLEQQYERVILVRSHSTALLEQRGHDIRKLTSSKVSRGLAPGG